MRYQTTKKIARNQSERKAPLWAAFVIVIGMTLMLGLAINYRAYSTMKVGVVQNGELSTKIQNLTDENLQLQDDINNLKTDPRVIEREAKRLGIPLSRK